MANWIPVGGAIRQITCKGVDHVVGLPLLTKGGSTNILRRNFKDNSWAILPATGSIGDPIWVAAGINNSIWHCNGSREIYRWDATGNKWSRMARTNSAYAAYQVDAWDDGRAVCVNDKQELFEYHNNDWKQLPGSGTHITIGDKGEKWHVSANRDVYRMKPGENDWKQVLGSPKLRSIHCTDSNLVAGVGEEVGPGANRGLYRWNNSNSSFTPLSDNGTHIGITRGSMWHVNEQGQIFRASF